jgi:hypothetical protein
MNTSDAPLLTFAVIADSHFHPEGHDPQSPYVADGLHNARNDVVVACINRAQPAFVMHLGDVPHPVPGVDNHQVALDVAKKTYDALTVPYTVVPGNHDVGDKPKGWATAPTATPERHAVFEAMWGASYGSFDKAGVHFLWIDTPVLNSGLPLEAEQEVWLQADLAAATAEGKRIFLFLHYPPYLCETDEPEHYDNLAEPARSHILNIVQEHKIEAVFCGHVHNFFWNRQGDTSIYILPATSFVRPEFSELCTIEPFRENGRDDIDKLGFFFVHIYPDGHRIEPIRTDGHIETPVAASDILKPGLRETPLSPLGATLRHDWTRPRSVPCGNLDEFRRKLARNDMVLSALLETGIKRLRVPAGDLLLPETAHRLRELSLVEIEVCVFSTGSTAHEHAAAVRDAAAWVQTWEIVTLDGMAPDEPWVRAARDAGVKVLTSVLGGEPKVDGPSEPTGKKYFSHFPCHGFNPGAATRSWAKTREGADGLIARVPDEMSPWDALTELTAGTQTPSGVLHVHLEVPRGGECERQVDDVATAHRLAEGLLAAAAHPNAQLYLDTFVDHDRGYFPRNGLMDRRGTPRLALHVLNHLARLVHGQTVMRQSTTPHRVFSVGDGQVIFTGDDVSQLSDHHTEQWVDLHLAHHAPVRVNGLYWAPNGSAL